MRFKRFGPITLKHVGSFRKNAWQWFNGTSDPVSASYYALRAEGSIHADHSPGFHGASSSSSCPLVTLYLPY